MASKEYSIYNAEMTEERKSYKTLKSAKRYLKDGEVIVRNITEKVKKGE